MTMSLATVTTPNNSNLPETSGDEIRQTASSTSSFSSLLNANDKTDNNKLQVPDQKKRDSSDEQDEAKDNNPGKINHVNNKISSSIDFDMNLDEDNKNFPEDVYESIYDKSSTRNDDDFKNNAILSEIVPNKDKFSIDKNDSDLYDNQDKKDMYYYDNSSISLYNNSDKIYSEVITNSNKENITDYASLNNNSDSCLFIKDETAMGKESEKNPDFVTVPDGFEAGLKGSKIVSPLVMNNVSDQDNNYALKPDSGQKNRQNGLQADNTGKNVQLVQTEPFMATAFSNIQSAHIEDIGQGHSGVTPETGLDNRVSGLTGKNRLPLNPGMMVRTDEKAPAYDQSRKSRNNSGLLSSLNLNETDLNANGVVAVAGTGNRDDQNGSSGNDAGFSQGFAQKNQLDSQHVDQDVHQMHADGFSALTMSHNAQSAVHVEDIGQNNSRASSGLMHNDTEALVNGDNNLPGKVGHLPSNLNVTVTTADKVPVHIQITKVEDNLAALSFQGTDEATTEVLKQTRHDLIHHLDTAGIPSTGVKITVLPPDTSNMSGENRGGSGFNNGSGFSGFSGQNNQQNSPDRGQNSHSINSIEPSLTSVHNDAQIIKTDNVEQPDIRTSADLVHRGINISA